MSGADAARMADMSWPDANPAFRRMWGMPRFLPRFPPKAPRIRACHDRAVLNGRDGIAPPFGRSP